MTLPAPYAGIPEIAGVPARRGKVRDVYAVGANRLLVVATDRISAFDVVLSPGVPGKGIVLNQLSNFWFDALADVAPNHLLARAPADFPPPFNGLAALERRAVLVRRLRMLPVECVVRGYLAGSGWKEYQTNGSVCGIKLPTGMSQADRLPEPIFTPSTKADVGHDQNIPFDLVVREVGAATAERVRALSIDLYRRAADRAERAGVIIADTKFEFGLDDRGALVWADEALTPDSSRFWPADDYRPGSNPPSFDKQFVRDWLETSGWNKRPPAPQLPEHVVQGTLDRYLEAFRRLTGRSLDRGVTATT